MIYKCRCYFLTKYNKDKNFFFPFLYDGKIGKEKMIQSVFYPATFKRSQIGK